MFMLNRGVCMGVSVCACAYACEKKRQRVNAYLQPERRRKFDK